MKWYNYIGDNMSLFLLFLAVLPTIILGYIIYQNDKIEKEPISLLFKLLISGVGAAILTLVMTYILYQILPFFATDNTAILNPISLAVYVFIGIAMIEELSKWIFIYLISWKNKAFNHVYDAIVYSVFVSLGFATIENVLYIFLNENLSTAIAIALNRMLFSVPGHAFFGVMMGYYLGLAKLTLVHGIKDKSQKYLFLSIIIPTTCHFIFDYILMLELPVIIFYAYVVVLFGVGISKVKRLSNVTTNIFNVTDNSYIYNAFGNNQNMQNNSVTTTKICFCKNCGARLIGPFCGYCGTKNY